MLFLPLIALGSYALIALVPVLGIGQHLGQGDLKEVGIDAVTREATEVLAPDSSFKELAERLVETGMPWNKPEPILAIPWAADSWSMSIW